MIQHAAVSLDLTLSQLTDPGVESLLVAAHQRGVAVRALLDYAGSGGVANLAAYSALQAGAVPVRWAPDSVVFHQSTITADHDISAVMTGGPAPGDTTTRAYVVFDRQPAAVASIESVFASDWSGAPVLRVPGAAGLVWSPGARLTLVGLIASAHHTLAVECGQLASMAMVSALREASRHGVTVTLTMTADPQWATAMGQLHRAGVRVATYPTGPATLAIQATALVVDASTAFVGSQLFTSASLIHDRELGLTTSDPAVVDPLALTLAVDFAGATPLGGGTPAGGPTATTAASTG
jgi:phosphatidylserine/phosphatidylglycerophosphate/cardiolipin synthase-like enzyme